MRRGLAIAALCGAVLAAAADTPLAALMASHTSPSRMWLGRGDVELPCYFARGGETGVTVLAWVRYAAYPTVWGALMIFTSHSEVPARATLEGGDELPSFLDLPSVPLSAGATWGASDVVPQDAAEVPGRNGFVVCINCDTTHDVTLVVGGAELEIPATNGYVRNVEVLKGDTSVSVAASSASASVRLALAVNPWVRFVSGPSLSYYAATGGMQMDAPTAITNCWTLVAWRADIAGGEMRETLEIIDRDGVRAASSSSSPAAAPALVRDARCRLSGGCMAGPVLPGGGRRALDLYGVKFAPRRLTDEEVWRVWELDLAEIRRRGLDTPLWAPGEGPQ